MHYTRELFRAAIIEKVRYSTRVSVDFCSRPPALSCCSAVSESDVGDQLVLLSSLAQLLNLDSCPSVSACKWHPVQKHCLPRARLPSIFLVSAIASSSFVLSTCIPKNIICLDVITFKRLLCVSALSTVIQLHWSIHQSMKYASCASRNHNSVASNRVHMVLQIVQPSHTHRSVETSCSDL